MTDLLTPEPRTYSVSELNATARVLLEEAFHQIWIEGEISNLRIPSSGHWYFTLKDERAQVRCVMFRGRNRFAAPQNANDGSAVRILGSVSLYPERGDFQILVQRMELAGRGNLQREFEQLKRKLAAEGLFEQARKQPLPQRPWHIAVVTSPTGAVLQDILRVLRQHNPAMLVTVIPVAVQGELAAPQVCAALGAVHEMPAGLGTPPIDAVIVARGGGSLEDLWAFNDERVARAIAACSIPVISAVGHETDVTIADFVADVRAPTPTAAALLVSADADALRRQLARTANTLQQRLAQTIQHAAERLRWMQRRLRSPQASLHDQQQALDGREQRLWRAANAALSARSNRLHHLSARLRPPTALLQLHQQRLQQLRNRQRIVTLEQLSSRAASSAAFSRRLVAAMERQVERAQQRVASTARALTSVSPLATLARGYSVLARPRDGRLLGEPVTQVVQAVAGEPLRAYLRDGYLDVTVTRAVEQALQPVRSRPPSDDQV